MPGLGPRLSKQNFGDYEPPKLRCKHLNCSFDETMPVGKYRCLDCKTDVHVAEYLLAVLTDIRQRLIKLEGGVDN